MNSLPNSLPLEDIQGNILRGYRLPNVRHFVLGIRTPDAARRVLGALAGEGDTDSLRITSAASWDVKPRYCLNIAFTFAGLQALGLPNATLQSFPEEFRGGAADSADALGDVGRSAPPNWLPGLRTGADAPPQIHILLSLYAIDRLTLEDLSTRLRHLFTSQDAITEYSCQDGETLPAGRVHFGYTDGLSQPHIEGSQPPKSANPHGASPAGDFLLGYAGSYITYPLPQPDALGLNGTFCAYRILRQDAAGFETYLEQAAAAANLDKELVAAKMCGRWRSGVPLALSPQSSQPEPALTRKQLNAFDYRPTLQFPDAVEDWQGFHCPLGSHIRRANPRSDDVAGTVHTTQVVNGKALVTDSGNPHRIIRRGIPYGPAYDPAKPDAAEEAGRERGLLLLVLCVSLRDQFEFLMTQWINGEIFAGATLPKDPLLGNIGDGEGQFHIPVQGQKPIHLQGFSRFIETRGAAYGFLPSLTALRYLSRSLE